MTVVEDPAAEAVVVEAVVVEAVAEEAVAEEAMETVAEGAEEASVWSPQLLPRRN